MTRLTNRLTRTLLLLSLACAPGAKSQTPQTAAPAPQTKAVSAAGEECGCESQSLPETLAIVNGVKITSSDIKKLTGDAVDQLHRQVIEARKRELDLMINSKLLAMEAQKRGVTTTKLLDEEVVAKVKPPTPVETQAFYDQNKARINGEFKDVSEQIVAYLSEQRQRDEAKKFADSLRAANDVKLLVTEATPPVTEADRARVFATIKGEAITSADVENSLLPMISDVQQQIYKLRKDQVELTINDTLLTQEAQKRKITTNALLEAEVKPKPVTEEQTRLFFEQNKERVSGDYTQTKDAIRQYLEEIEMRTAEREFVERLRATAAIQVFLVAPPKTTATAAKPPTQ